VAAVNAFGEGPNALSFESSEIVISGPASADVATMWALIDEMPDLACGTEIVTSVTLKKTSLTYANSSH
jgi:hypothetical protein